MQHKCFKCGTEFDGNFCPECGEKWLEAKTCPKCGATLAGNAKFCNECGYSFISVPQPQKPAATPTPQPAPVEPEHIDKPVKPRVNYRDTVPEDRREELMPKMEKHIKKKRTIAGIILLFLVLKFSTVFSILTLKFNLINVFIIIYGFTIPLAIVSLGIIVWSRLSHSTQWDPSKIYRNGKLIFPLVVDLGISLLSHYCLAEWGTDAGIPYAASVTLICVSVCMVIISIVLVSITLKERKALCLALCGYVEPSKNPELQKQYAADFQELEKRKAEYKRQREIYWDNKKRWAVYRYQMSKYSKGKSYKYVPRLRIWCSVHKKALSVTAVALAAVITVTCVVATRDRRFRAESLVKIGLGADEARVIEVLGEPSEKTSTTWYYYSKNFVSLQEDFAALEEKMMDAESMEELEKLYNESEKLDEKMKTIEYQWISVEFSIDNKVYEMALDTTAVYEKKQEKAVESITTFQEGATRNDFYSYSVYAPLSYAILYQDGSYWTGYFSDAQLPTKSGAQAIQWSNEWGSYSVTITVAK